VETATLHGSQGLARDDDDDDDDDGLRLHWRVLTADALLRRNIFCICFLLLFAVDFIRRMKMNIIYDIGI